MSAVEQHHQPLLPPHNLEAEQSVLGAILLADTTLYGLVINEGLKPEHFYREQHAAIYRAMLDLYEESREIDVLTVAEQLRQTGQLEQVGGPAMIDSLAGAAPAAGNVREYARIVQSNALLRRLLTTTQQIQANVYGHEAPARELVEWAERDILEVAHDDRQKDFRSIGEVLHDEVDKLHRLSLEHTALTGTPSGYKDLDEITGGFQPGNLVILAARPSMGKCLREGASVYDPARGSRRRIEDVVASVERGEEAWVASVGPDLKLRPARVSAALRSGRQAVFRLTTRLGRRVEATANHPLLTASGWRELRELAPGGRIAVPRWLPRSGAPQRMDDRDVVLLAALIADGNLTQKTPRFCFGDDSPVLAEVERAAAAYGLRVHLGERSHGTATISAGRGAPAPNPVRQLCERHGIWGKRSADKFVPDAIFALDDDQIARFLSVLYGCDGHVHAGERFSQIGYSTISERLARDVQHLLLRLGIVATIRTLKRDAYAGTTTVAREVRITGQDGLTAFCRRIGACGKQAQGDRVLAQAAAVRRKTNVDTLPVEVWSRVIDAKGARPWRELAVATDSVELAQLATSDLWWDEIASIEPIGEHETYDLTVPGDHNFVADDVVVHNSALVTNIAENAALEHGKPVALFSLEMSEAELAQRFVASQARIRGEELRKGRVAENRWPKILEACQRLSDAPLYVDDSSDIGILELRAKARRLHQQSENGLGLIILDYLQLMRADSRIENRVEAVGQMSRGLKILARELQVPVIALSQLSRAVESRTDKRPILSDLRECVTGDTLVLLADGRRVPIVQLVGTQPQVLTIDERDRVASARSDAVWRVGRREVHTVRLASGRTLRATSDHRIRTGGGWRTLGSLQPGDRVALARELPEPATPERWQDDRVVLLGQLIGDGSYLPGQPLRYTTASEENSRAVRESAERAFGSRVSRHAGRGSWHQLVIAGNGTRWKPAGVGAWLRDLGVHGQRSHEKRVPEAAFRLPADQVGLLLRHLWATDGSIFTGRGANGRRVVRVAYTTTSAGLAEDVMALLLRVGIVARLAVTAGGRHPVRHVVVSGAEAQQRFLERVGAFGPRVAQAARLEAVLAETRATTNVDTAPIEAWDAVREAMAAGGVTTRAMAAQRGTAYGGTAHFRFAPSRATLLDYSRLLDDEAIRAWATSELFWDRVVAVEPAGEEDVFDLTVPGTACWLADGVVSHNSGNIEQDADLVMFIYRDEYYDRESEREGEADIIIAKHRNGALGDVTLTFQKEYPKFMNFAGDRFG